MKVVRRPWFVRLRNFWGTNLGLAIFYLSLIIVAEIVTALFEPRLGLVLHGLVFLAILFHAALGSHGPQQGFLLSQTLAPLVRILSLAFPLKYFPNIYWYAIVGTPLILAAFLTARLMGLRRVQIGLTIKALPLQIMISFIGIVLGFVEYKILRPFPLVRGLSLDQVLLPALILLIFTGFLEEVIFRGVMYYASLRSLGRFGIVYVATIFAVLHIGYKSWLDVLFVFLVALIFGWLALRTGSILGITLAHGITNISLFLVFPFLLSLHPLKPTPLPDQAIIQYTVEARNPGAVQPSSSPGFTPTPSQALPVAWATPPVTAFRSTPTSTPAPHPVNPYEIIVDNDSSGFIQQGEGLYVSSLGYGGNFIWSYSTDQGATVEITWHPSLPNCGQYQVDVYLPSGLNLTHTALYEIGDRHGMAGRLVDQSSNAGKWVTLGIFDLLPTDGSFLRLDNRTDELNQAGEVIVFDAARWTRVGPCQSASH